MPRTEYRKGKQKGLLATFPTLLEQHPLLKKRKPVEGINIIDSKKIRLYRLITMEEKRRKTPDISTIKSKDTS